MAQTTEKKENKRDLDAILKDVRALEQYKSKEGMTIKEAIDQIRQERSEVTKLKYNISITADGMTENGEPLAHMQVINTELIDAARGALALPVGTYQVADSFETGNREVTFYPESGMAKTSVKYMLRPVKEVDRFMEQKGIVEKDRKIATLESENQSMAEQIKAMQAKLAELQKNQSKK